MRFTYIKLSTSQFLIDQCPQSKVAAIAQKISKEKSYQWKP